jgi:hypothetical protein
MSRRPSEFFAPAPLAAVALLGVNDHLLKPLLHDALTGKLSDVALCFFLPLLISALLRPLWRADRPRLLVAALIAGAVFTVLELSLMADRWYSAALAAVGRPLGVTGAVFTRDPTDLLCLSLVPLAYWYGLRRVGADVGAAIPRLARAGVLGATMLLLGATTRTPECDQRAAPVTFRVQGDCGAGGIVVVSVDGDREVTVYNGQALFAASSGRYTAGLCPARLDQGGWTLYANQCPPGDGGSCDPSWSCPATREGGTLWVTCQSSGSRTGCRSRLTLVQD